MSTRSISTLSLPDSPIQIPTGVTGILLAAGHGTRFGGDKCLAPLPDGTAVGLRAAQNLKPAIQRLLCVVRPDDPVLSELLLRNEFELVLSEDSALGMSASLQAGIRASSDTTRGWLIALADMPAIKPQTHLSIAQALEQRGGIVVPQYAGKRGHPVAFSVKHRAGLLALNGDRGARSLLTHYAGEVHHLTVNDPGIHQDIDTPADLLRIKTSLATLP